MSRFLGDYLAGSIIYADLNTFDSDGASVTIATDGTLAVWKNDSTTQDTDGLTFTEDFDALTGIHMIKVDTTADATFYAAGNDFFIRRTGMTIDGVAVNATIAQFSLENRNRRSDLRHWNGTAVATPDTAGYPKVTIKSGTGTGELNLSSGRTDANVTYLNGIAVVSHAGTAQAVGTTTITLASSASAEDDVYNGWEVQILSATTGALQNVQISNYVGATRVATIGSWPKGTPTGTVTYDLDPNVLSSATLTAEQIATEIFSTTLTEAYSTVGAEVTLTQFVYEVLSVLFEAAKSGTTVSHKKRDGTTQALTIVVDDADDVSTMSRGV